MLITDETIEQYHAHKAVSHSKLRDFDTRGPRYYLLRWISGALKGPDSAAFRSGRAFETFLFEPTNFDAWFAVKPENYDGRKLDGKAWKTANEASGKVIVERADFASFEYMAKAIRECATASMLLEGATYQATRRIPWEGLPGLQSRPEFWNPEGCPASGFRPYTLDLKTTRSLSEITSGRSILNYGYHSQAGIARLCSEDPNTAHYLIVAEKALPNRAMVVELSETFVRLGESWARGALCRLAEHYGADYWPLTTQDSMVVEPPAWALRVDEIEDEPTEDENEDWGLAPEAQEAP